MAKDRKRPCAHYVGAFGEKDRGVAVLQAGVRDLDKAPRFLI